MDRKKAGWWYEFIAKQTHAQILVLLERAIDSNLLPSNYFFIFRGHSGMKAFRESIEVLS